MSKPKESPLSLLDPGTLFRFKKTGPRLYRLESFDGDGNCRIQLLNDAMSVFAVYEKVLVSRTVLPVQKVLLGMIPIGGKFVWHGTDADCWCVNKRTKFLAVCTRTEGRYQCTLSVFNRVIPI